MKLLGFCHSVFFYYPLSVLSTLTTAFDFCKFFVIKLLTFDLLIKITFFVWILKKFICVNFFLAVQFFYIYLHHINQ